MCLIRYMINFFAFLADIAFNIAVSVGCLSGRWFGSCGGCGGWLWRHVGVAGDNFVDWLLGNFYFFYFASGFRAVSISDTVGSGFYSLDAILGGLGGVLSDGIIVYVFSIKGDAFGCSLRFGFYDWLFLFNELRMSTSVFSLVNTLGFSCGCPCTLWSFGSWLAYGRDASSSNDFLRWPIHVYIVT